MDDQSWLKPLPREFADGGMSVKRRFIFAGITAIVLMGFAVIIWFSYTSQTEEIGIIPVVRADNSVVKEKPENPGGKEILFQDKEVFDRVDNNQKEDQEIISSSSEILLKRPVAIEPEPALEKPIQQEEVIIEVKADPDPVEIKAVPGEFMIQIGAFADRKKAENFWMTIKNNNSSVMAKLSPNYMVVDLGNKGVLYRVRGGMIKSRDAAINICASLKKNNQNCIVVTN